VLDDDEGSLEDPEDPELDDPDELCACALRAKPAAHAMIVVNNCRLITCLCCSS